MTPSLQLTGISKRYPSPIHPPFVVEAFNLVAHAGSLTWLRGPSGSGKSTVIRVAGLLTEPDEGEVVVAGTIARGRSQRDELRARHIGIVFQNANLLPDLSLAQNLEIAALDRNPAILTALADRFGLAGVRHRPGRLLSGGEAQRAAICRALVNKPVVLLADEPTSALDDDNAQTVLNELRRAADEGAAVVIASHDPRVGTIADTSITLSGGHHE